MTQYLDTNLERTYPFVYVADEPADMAMYAAVVLNGIVDCGFVFGPGAGYVPNEHRVWLSSVERDTDNVTFVFSTDAPALLLARLAFTVPLAQLYALTWVDYALTDSASSASSEALDEGCGEFPLVRGFLVAGDLTKLASELASATTYVWSDVEHTRVEPGRLQSLTGVVTSINLANFSRTQLDPAAGCDGEVPQNSVHVHTRCIVGDVVFVEGYNTAISQSNTANSLTISGVVGGGTAGRPCEEVPRYPGEVSPDGGDFLSGGPACNQVIKTINGAGGRKLPLITGPGIVAAADPLNPSKLIVSLEAGAFAACVPRVSEDSSSEFSVSESSASSESAGSP